MANVDRSIYQTPLTGRYASKEMKHLFSDDIKFSYWRKLWVALAEAEQATGTQETFMELMSGDFVSANSVEEYIANQFDFEIYPVSGQTYPRNLDEKILHLLSEIATSAYKMANDIRLMQHDKEVEEPFGKNQIGSSAMAYKRNPMRCERICSLSRHVQTLSMDATQTASVQWLERTLDDSANRRICMPEAFLGIDAILIICGNVADGLVVNDKVIHKHLMEELPFMATEPILMEAVKKGGDRQELHERIRKHSMKASEQIKKYGKPNDLVNRIAKDPAFGMSKEEILKILDPSKLTGRAAAQTKAYLEDTVYPTLRFYDEDFDDIDTNVEV